jgi:hypothetical protein
MKKLLLLITLTIFISSHIHAQRVDLGTNAHLAIPQGDFRNNIDALGGGISFYGMYGFPNSPLSVGLDFSFTNFGTDSRDEPISTTIPDVRVQVDNSYNLGQGFLTLRLQPQYGSVRPYLETLAGWSYFYTETSINDRRSSNSGEPIASDTNFEDWALAYGVGTGLQFRLFNWSERIPESVDGEFPPIGGYLTIGGRYLFGNEAEYLKKGSVQSSNGNVTYDVSRSKTDMMLVQVGFVFQW